MNSANIDAPVDELRYPPGTVILVSSKISLRVVT